MFIFNFYLDVCFREKASQGQKLLYISRGNCSCVHLFIVVVAAAAAAVLDDDDNDAAVVAKGQIDLGNQQPVAACRCFIFLFFLFFIRAPQCNV